MGSCASIPQLLTSGPSLAVGPSPSVFVEKQQFEDIHEHYAFNKELRKGSRWVLHRVSHKASHKQYACKSTNKSKLCSLQDLDNIRTQIQVHQALSHFTADNMQPLAHAGSTPTGGHPHIVQLVGCFEDQMQAHIVMEECTGCDLFEHMKNAGPLPEPAAAAAMQCVLAVVQHCHACGVVHRGIQPESFMFLTSSPAAPLKAVDFGCAGFLQDIHRDEVVGSPHYVAPEMLLGAYGAEVDMWSCGVLLYSMLCGYHPFQGTDNLEIFQQICSSPLDFKTQPWPCISAAGRDLVGRMLVKDPKKRITAKQALRHDWFVEQVLVAGPPTPPRTEATKTK